MIDISAEALYWCCLCNDTYNALELINMGNIDYGHVDKNGKTLLIRACRNTMPEVALALIATGESNSEHHTNNNGPIALVWACANKMPEVALALIATGLSNNWHFNNLAIGYARYNNMQNVVNALLAL